MSIVVASQSLDASVCPQISVALSDWRRAPMSSAKS